MTANPASPILECWRGLSSLAGMAAAPLGRLACGTLDNLDTPERREHGLVLVLPGIESESTVNHSLALGLADGGVRQAIELFDWTTGCSALFLWHLRGGRRHRAQAKRLAEKICAYQDEYPGRGVYLVGHSGGGAMSLLALDALPEGRTVRGTMLLAAAVSPRFDLRTALRRSERGVWNFSSPLDLFFLAAATLLLGTLDGRHVVAAGATGFVPPSDLDEAGSRLYREKLHERPFKPQMARNWNLGGHLGPMNRAFAATWLAPILNEPD